jgi:beta-lactamase superfamily II metal-dependent hydrolase
LAVLCGTLAAAEKATTFYMVDVGQGNATFIVPPSGQVRK